GEAASGKSAGQRFLEQSPPLDATHMIRFFRHFVSWFSRKGNPRSLTGSQWTGTTFTDLFRRNREPTPNELLGELKGTAWTCASLNAAVCAAYLREGDVLFVDNGTSFTLLGLKLPPNCTFVGSINWRSSGYSVVAVLGTSIASSQWRQILFVGDVSLQVSVQELPTILRHDHKPVIFLINNGGYTIERGYLGKDEPYNDIANWAYADLPKVFRRDTSARSFVVNTNADLQKALSEPNDKMIFVESIIDRSDALPPSPHT